MPGGRGRTTSGRCGGWGGGRGGGRRGRRGGRRRRRDRVRQVVAACDAVAPQVPDEELRPVRDFAAQLHRALAGDDEDLVERSAHDLEAAWNPIADRFPAVENGADAAT